MQYKNEEITLTEARSLGNEDYTVTRENGLVFHASSRFGDAFAQTGPQALDLAKKLIDSNK